MLSITIIKTPNEIISFGRMVPIPPLVFQRLGESIGQSISNYRVLISINIMYLIAVNVWLSVGGRVYLNNCVVVYVFIVMKKAVM